MSKFCKDCVHYRPPNAVFAYVGKCSCCHPDLISEPEPVEGHRAAANPAEERAPYGRCGPEAKHFSPKPAAPEKKRRWWE